MLKALLRGLQSSSDCYEEEKVLEIALRQFRKFNKAGLFTCANLAILRFILIVYLKENLPFISVLIPSLFSVGFYYCSKIDLQRLTQYNLLIAIFRTCYIIGTFELILALPPERVFFMIILVHIQQQVESLQVFAAQQQFVHSCLIVVYFLIRSSYAKNNPVTGSDIVLVFYSQFSNYMQESLLSELLRYVNEKMAKIQNLEMRWSTLLKNLGVGIGVFSEKDLTIQFFNNTLRTIIEAAPNKKEVEQRLLGLTLVFKDEEKKEEMKMEEFLRQIIKVEGGSSLEEPQSLLLKKFVENQQHCMLKIKESKKVIQIQFQSYKENGEDLIMIMLQEVTSMKKLQKSKNLQRMKTIYFCSVAHDLKTPLNSIISTNEFLMNQFKEDARISKLFKVNRSSCQFLQNIIDDITDLSKIELKEFSLDYEWFSVVDVLNEVQNVMSLPIQMKKICFDYRLERGRFPYENGLIWSDPKRLKQILFNLVSNAVKFTARGGIKIIVRLQQLQEPEEEKRDLNEGMFESQEAEEQEGIMEFQVRDTGLGIKQEDIAKLFRLFGKLSHTNNINHSGIGLGLTICKTLSQLLGGDISVESVYGCGTTFTFTIKVKIRKEEELSISEALEIEDFSFLEEGQNFWQKERELTMKTLSTLES